MRGALQQLVASNVGARAAHGVRVRYIAGCRCAACRKANSAYEVERAKARKAGDWNGIVDAARARDHMLALRHQGVGRRTVQACTDIADTVLQEIVSGRRERIRARTERKILQVKKAHAADRALTSAGRTHQLIRLLLEEGYTEAFLAQRLGYKTAHLQFNATRVTVRNAARVKRLYQELTA